MIPDFPQEKEKLMQYWNNYLSARCNERLCFSGTFLSYMNHEGHKWALNRADGTKDDQTYHEIQSLINIDVSEVPSLTPDKIQEKLDKIVDEMTTQVEQNMFVYISRLAKEVGNEVNAEGQPLTQELFLQMLDKMDFEFDESGNWKPPSIIIDPDLWAAKKDEIKSWETDEAFQAKQKALIEKKKEEWRDRENNRKLVD